jgi:putative flippase GtrA
VLITARLRAAVAGALGYLLGIVVHYMLSAAWVFPDRHGARRAAPTFAKFLGTGLLGLATTAVIIDLITRNGLAGAFVAKAAAAAATYVAVFLLRRMYVFAPASQSLMQGK